MRARSVKFIAAAAVLVSAISFVTAASAAINIANNKPIIGGSGDYTGNPYNSGLFPTYNVTNGYNASPDNNTGTIYEQYGDGSYWIGHNSQATGYFVLDLGAAYSIGQFELFNTRNGPYRDRGTGNFTISASNAVTLTGFGFDLVSPVQIASGTLTSQNYSGFAPGLEPLISDWFNSTNSTPFRFLRFDALSMGAIGIPYGLNGVGLNELRVFEALAPVPEPSTMIVLGTIGAIGYRLRRKFMTLLS